MTGSEISGRQYLDPQVLSRVSTLALRARYVVEGVLTGIHRSIHRGQSIEFAEHKEYSPGDEVRHIDWKAYGKRDKYYVKQYEHETNLRAWMVLDASGSMGFPLALDGCLSKFEYGATLTAALTYIMLQQGDAVGLMALQGHRRTYVPPRAQSSHLQDILGVVEVARPGGRTDLPAALEGLVGKIRRRGMAILISDLLGPKEGILRALRLLIRKKVEVVIFHILTREEIEFPFTSPSVFVGLEGEGQALADPEGIRSSYLKEFQDWLDSCRKECFEEGIDYYLCRTSDPPDRSLLQYFARRESLG